MSKIIIHRKKDWSLKIGYDSISEVLVDGQRIGYVSGGETTEFDVVPGQHTLKIKKGWYGSRDLSFNLYNKETRSFTVSSIRRYVTVAAILFIILIQILHLVLKVHLSREIIYSILAAIALMAIGFHVFGRNAYLFIRENK